MIIGQKARRVSLNGAYLLAYIYEESQIIVGGKHQMVDNNGKEDDDNGERQKRVKERVY